MSWSATERACRIGWSALLAFFLTGMLLDVLTVAGILHPDEYNGPPIWQIQGFLNIRAYAESSGEQIFLLLFALAGLWITQRRRWLNWAWSMPLLSNLVLHAYIYP
ncbi:hypothetical protein D3C81_824160 [compost metagenome]|jgi:hypothetical protein|uniref:Uncharacterized protein n=1 Tax=Cupriavidus campinensis TaxID=151783 RepID=A0AAE9I7L4_9BURK|nr:MULTISPECIES: hypothetical protein [Cupriavidus]TSP14394.1 hypothetical protein FGG12_01660 [Cupriavidus campinensis]URF05571.1 hypothetical protein M5D45_07160 [Cupriavidus campinensis]CAG2146311.1 hypothetical protein LMG19282_02912 [Cupriavidus campinensis]